MASNGNKVQTNEIAKRAVTGKKLAPDSVKSGKIVDGKVKAKDLAPDVIPTVPEQAYGRVNKSGPTVAVDEGAVGITGATAGGVGRICYDLAFEPNSGNATMAAGPPGQPGATVDLVLAPAAGCPAPFTEAATATRALKRETTGDPEQDEPADRDVFVHFIR